jgi:uncharacterized protein (TIGR02246 family)
MKMLAAAVTAITLTLPSSVWADDKASVRTAIQSFYKSFDDGFTGSFNYATEDWNHINPSGGRTRGRDATLKEVRSVHQSFLRGTTDTVEDMDVRFASPTVVIGTVTSVMSAFTMPDGVKHEAERHIRTFVLVKRGERWLIMQDQNTTISLAVH